MVKSYTALVLTPSLGGDFFGELLVGLSREVASSHGHLVVVETLQEHALHDEAGAQGNFSAHVAWDAADGVVAITTAVGMDYLRGVGDAGKPCVLLSSSQIDGFDAPEARPDNEAGTRAAVEHLIAHGHTDIGFVGNPGQRDIQDRLDAYQQSLASHDLAVDPAFVFAAPDNGEDGGAKAARLFIEASPRPSAVMVATDRNAVGFMRALEVAGIAVPLDVAVVSFDNTAGGTISTPTLTSVEPNFDEVGALAGRVVVAQMCGASVPGGTVTPESAMLVVRASCGCRGDGQEPTAQGAVDGPGMTRVDLESVLLRGLRTGDEEADARAREVASATVTRAIELVETGQDVTAEEVEEFAAELLSVATRPALVRHFSDALRAYAVGASEPSGSFDGQPPAFSLRLGSSLWRAQASASLRQSQVTDAAIVEQYVVDAGLVDPSGGDPRDLRWLEGTHVKAAMLALWDSKSGPGRLTIAGAYDAELGLGDAVGTTVRTEEFPPRELIIRATLARREVCVVVPVSTKDREWGYLAIVASMDAITSRDTYQHWAALLSAALESQRRQEEVLRSAHFDSLTGLPNRRLFVRELDQALARWRRSRTPFSVLFMDLDGFKLINDTLGHQMGDRLLQSVGVAIAEQVREVDTAARFGGDEFVVLLSDTDAAQALTAAKRVQAAVSELREFDGHVIVTRASVGIATSAVSYQTAEEVLSDADAAMYSAKTREPGSVSLFDEPMHEEARAREVLAKEVVQALQGKQFEVHYQPIVNLSTSRTDRFEALLRWRHPDRGLLATSDFLAAIEDTALMVQLGRWVIDEVCRQIAEWGPGVVNVSINISDKEFWSQDLMQNVLDAVERHGLTTDRITLEITESVLMRRPELALRLMTKLHEAGLLLHIDAFGIGFSSLETLHRFPVDAFKIDRSFIHKLARADRSAELISSLVNLGRALGLAVVAEGVETDDQLDYLRELGCATGQGFLFMPAVDAARARELLGEELHVVAPSLAR